MVAENINGTISAIENNLYAISKFGTKSNPNIFETKMFPKLQYNTDKLPMIIKYLFDIKISATLLNFKFIKMSVILILIFACVPVFKNNINDVKRSKVRAKTTNLMSGTNLKTKNASINSEMPQKM